jgi:hypothetical protein
MALRRLLSVPTLYATFFLTIGAVAMVFAQSNIGGNISKQFITGSDYSNAGGAGVFTNVTGLAFPVAASTSYAMRCSVVWSASAVTTGPEFQITGPASPTSVAINMVSAITAITTASAATTAFSSAMNPVGAAVTSATNEMARIDLNFVNGVNAGTVQLQAAPQGVGTLTIRQGSSCVLQ